MKERILLRGKAAEIFFKASTEKQDFKYTDFGEDYAGIGGYYPSDIDGVFIAFDFTDGKEVFIEDFDDIDEAYKYASGIQAYTKDEIFI